MNASLIRKVGCSVTEADCDLFSSFLLDAALNAAMREVERVDVLGAGAGRDEAVRAALLEQVDRW
ncbi:MAG: hypothetical protein OXK20_06765 [Deltaproteobacteria bacterium]|nr:hypothetical protein [Deltaproteobacteria bacterium]